MRWMWISRAGTLRLRSQCNHPLLPLEEMMLKQLRGELEAEQIGEIESAVALIKGKYERKAVRWEQEATKLKALAEEKEAELKTALDKAANESTSMAEQRPVASTNSSAPVSRAPSTPRALSTCFRSGEEVVVLWNQDRDGKGEWARSSITEERTELGRSGAVRTTYRVYDTADDKYTWIGDGAGRDGTEDAVLLYPWQHAAVRLLTKLEGAGLGSRQEAVAPDPTAQEVAEQEAAAHSSSKAGDSSANTSQKTSLNQALRYFADDDSSDDDDGVGDGVGSGESTAVLQKEEELPESRSPGSVRPAPSFVPSASVSAASAPSASVASASEEVSPALMRRLLAFRQYIEVKRMGLGTKATSKPWKLRVNRLAAAEASTAAPIAGGGIEHAGVLKSFRAVLDDPKRKRSLLYCNTVVSFIDPFGSPEDGCMLPELSNPTALSNHTEQKSNHRCSTPTPTDDLGGLTTEMYSLFWKSVLRPAAGLFEESAGAGGGFLPKPGAAEEQLEAAGLVLIKCILDDHPIGHGLCSFVIDYLVNGNEAMALSDLDAALRALSGFDRTLANGWRSLLDDPSSVDELGLTLEDFNELSAEPLAAVTQANLEAAIVSGCHFKLLGVRQSAFSALRRGFAQIEDLSVQLGALGSAEDLALLLQGKHTLSAAELIGCFAMPGDSVEEEREAGFAAVGSNVPRDFTTLVQDEATFHEGRRVALLRWCTALHALPVGGLKDDRIKLRIFGDEADDLTLPETHTCTRELHLPNYSSLSVLRNKLLQALDHESDGFGKE